MMLVFVAAWSLMGAAPAPARVKSPDAPARTETLSKSLGVPALLPRAAGSHPATGKTKCSLCHTPAGWERGGFAHDRTGFPLRGKHSDTACSACHGNDFQAPLPKACAGCHRDPHAGDVGLYCQGCHDENNWRSRHTVEAHRTALFPLRGVHAMIPCTECHAGFRGDRFVGPSATCESCHMPDYQRTVGTDIDHVRLGLSTRCRDCHGPQRFVGARYPAHDSCFLIGRGVHAGIPCLQCHSQIPPNVTPGACNTGTATCTTCHDHEIKKTDGEHKDVAGYQYRDRKCVECHPFTPGGR